MTQRTGVGTAAAVADPSIHDNAAVHGEAPDDLVGYRLRRVHGAFLEAWKEFFGALGVTVTPVQGGILMLIARHPGLTQSELARRLRIEAPTLHESVRRLIDADLIERASMVHDRRAHALRLTASGEALSALLQSRIDEQESAALAPLDAGERRQLAALLGKILSSRE